MEQITRSTFNNNCNQQSVQNEQALVSFSISEPIFEYNMSSFTFPELLHIFPEAKSIAKRETKRHLAEAENIVKRYAEIKEEYTQEWLTKEKPRYHRAILEGIDEGYAKGLEKLTKEVNKYKFRLLFIDGKTKGTLNIERAKKVPITSLIEVRKDGKARCVWHSERTPSMHVYKNNKAHCFGCGKRGDVVDVFQALNGVDFKTAVTSLQSYEI